MQRLLWLSDYFIMYFEFEKICIKEIINPRINKRNSLTFLCEAFKKLKACDNSNDIWYLLLNNCMNIAANNFLYLLREKNEDLIKINGKLFEEIIERSLKFSNKKNTFESIKILDYYIENNKKITDIFELIDFQSKSLAKKQINCKLKKRIINFY